MTGFYPTWCKGNVPIFHSLPSAQSNPKNRSRRCSQAGRPPSRGAAHTEATGPRGAERGQAAPPSLPVPQLGGSSGAARVAPWCDWHRGCHQQDEARPAGGWALLPRGRQLPRLRARSGDNALTPASMCPAARGGCIPTQLPALPLPSTHGATGPGLLAAKPHLQLHANGIASRLVPVFIHTYPKASADSITEKQNARTQATSRQFSKRDQ